MSEAQIFDGEAGEIHPLITSGRESNSAHYVVTRYYPGCDEAEACALKLPDGQSLKRGGGAKRKNTEKSDMDRATYMKSISRARTTIRRKSLSMGADRMLTLTFRENVSDIEESWACFKYFIRLMRRFYKDNFQYIAVPEYQKRGAVHFHLAVSGFQEVGIIRRLWRRAAGYRGGNIDVTSPKKAGKNSWNPRRVGNYISKYISKSDVVGFNKRRYSSGGKIQMPDPERGWLSFGAPVALILRDVIENRSRKSIDYLLEGEGMFGLVYVST